MMESYLFWTIWRRRLGAYKSSCRIFSPKHGIIMFDKGMSCVFSEWTGTSFNIHLALRRNLYPLLSLSLYLFSVVQCIRKEPEFVDPSLHIRIKSSFPSTSFFAWTLLSKKPNVITLSSYFIHKLDIVPRWHCLTRYPWDLDLSQPDVFPLLRWWGYLPLAITWMFLPAGWGTS